MPITVNFQPSAAVLGSSAYAGGAGQFAKWLREQQLREAALAQQDIQQQRAIAAQQQSQVFAANNAAARDAQEMAFRGNMAGFGAALEDRRAARDRGFAVEDRDFLADHRLGLAEMEDARMREGARIAGVRTEIDDLRILESEIAESFKPFHTGDAVLDDGTRKELSALRGARTSILKNDGLTSEERRKLLIENGQKTLAAISSVPPPLPGDVPKPLAERIPELRVPEPVLAPDGSFMGYNVWTEETRAGATRQVAKFIPYKAPEDARQKAWASYYGTQSGKTDDVSGEPLSLDTIRKNFKEYWAGVQGGPDGVPPLDAGPAGEQPTPIPNHVPGVDDQPTPIPPHDPQVPLEIQQLNEPSVPPPVPPLPEKPKSKGVKSKVDPRVAEMALSLLPRIMSKAEFDSLPSGTHFIAPDGKPRIKP
jgi:hypothetical protein